MNALRLLTIFCLILFQIAFNILASLLDEVTATLKNVTPINHTLPGRFYGSVEPAFLDSEGIYVRNKIESKVFRSGGIAGHHYNRTGELSSGLQYLS